MKEFLVTVGAILLAMVAARKLSETLRANGVPIVGGTAIPTPNPVEVRSAGYDGGVTRFTVTATPV